jgi:signal transduction histidine kinase
MTSDHPLRKVGIFAGLTEEDLDRLAAGVTPVHLSEGDRLFQEGDGGSHAFVIEQGELEVIKATEGREILLAVRGEGEVIGEMALLEEAPRSATVRARTAASLLSIPRTTLEQLLESSTTATRALFEAVLTRWQETESRLRMSQRMAQLGTLTAGLAHELNNPAGAVGRAAQQLRNAVDDYGAALVAATRAGADVSRERESLPSGDGTARLSALERSDRETELEGELAEIGIDRPWDLATDLVAAGVTADVVRSTASRLEQEAVGPTLAALAAGHRIQALLDEVGEGASRLSSIVGALKSYSYLDQAPLQEVDVRRGLDDTMLILKHELDGIDVERVYDEDTPVIEGFAPELNQVWTNLLANAADAVSDAGTATPSIVVRTGPGEKGAVVVEIEDNGPGIPQEVQARIFDPFFTTKPPGSGTGLGLDISRGIVVQRHRGEITVDSAPGRTVFTVTLPGEQPDTDG